MNFDKLSIPVEGERINIDNDRLCVPDKPIIPFIEGDGIGPDIMKSARLVWDKAVEYIYGNKRKIYWLELFAGEKAKDIYGEVLPQDTIRAIEYFVVAIKGPLTTPVGSGYRSLNVALRQKLDLYACVRPSYYFEGVPSPVKNPQDLNVVIFRENTEDVYAGIEWAKGSDEAKKIIEYIKNEFDVSIREDSGIGIKPISEFATKRLVRKAINYALKYRRSSVTLVHKGNIMKFTEGAFKQWGYEVAEDEFREYIITEEELATITDKSVVENKVVVKDRIADAMFQQILTRPKEYDVIVLPNLNGDYLSDACAAQIGGLGMAPGANIGDFIALFEPCHGSAPKYANQNKVNPTALILSGVMMFEYLGWEEVACLIKQAVGETILQRKVTYDLARLMDKDIQPISTLGFAEQVVNNFP